MDQHLTVASALAFRFHPVSLGDKLQLMARLYPRDLAAINLIVDDVLQQRLRTATLDTTNEAS